MISAPLCRRKSRACWQHMAISTTKLQRFALAQRQCRHNLNYWLFGDYLGIGAGAHSKLSLPDGIVRQARQRQPQAYLEAVSQGRPIQTENEVLIADLGFEFMMNALRLTDGFSLGLFAQRTGLSVADLQVPLDVAVQRGLLEIEGQWVRPTLLGQRFLNDLLQLFLADDDA